MVAQMKREVFLWVGLLHFLITVPSSALVLKGAWDDSM
jgi:hypothetical protein